MKRILFLVLLFVVATTVKAQYPVTQFLGSDSAMVKSRGGLQGRFAPIPFTDTAAANLSRISQYPGALIYTSGVDKYWYRNATVTGWIEFTSSGGSTVNIYNSDGALTGARTVDGDGNGLQFNSFRWFAVGADSVQIALNAGVFRVTGMTSTQDTSTYKPIVVDPVTGRVMQSSYWYGGSGGSGADSSVFATLYRVDTAKANIRTSLNTKADTGSVWKRVGNAGTGASDFIGTIDVQPIRFRINNVPSGYISASDGLPYPVSDGGSVRLGQYAGVNLGDTNELSTLIGYGAGYSLKAAAGGQSVMIGNWAGYLTDSTTDVFGNRSVLIGQSAAFRNKAGASLTYVGTFAGEMNNVGAANTGIGRDAMRSNVDGLNNTGVGLFSLLYNTTGIDTISVTNPGSGYTSATVTISAPPTGPPGTYYATATATAIIDGGEITGIEITNPGGGYSLVRSAYHTGITVTITGDGVGATAAVTATKSGSYNTGIGAGAGMYGKRGSGNTSLGYLSSWRADDSYMTLLGYGTGAGTGAPTTMTNAGAIGYDAKVSASNTIAIGKVNTKVVVGGETTTAGFEVVNSNGAIIDSIGIDAKGLYSGEQTSMAFGIGAMKNASGSHSTAVGYKSQEIPSSSSNASHNTSVGTYALRRVNQFGNSAFGSNSGINIIGGYRNTGIGAYTIYSDTNGVSNTGVGFWSLNSLHGKDDLSYGVFNSALGDGAGASITTGSRNTALGAYSMGLSTLSFFPGTAQLSGSNNTGVGVGSLFYLSSGSDNIGVGYNSGVSLTTGSYNVIIGSNSGSTIATANRRIIISDGEGTSRLEFDSVGNGLFTGTGGSRMNIGTTAQRPTPTAGTIRWNTDSTGFEYSNGTTWEMFGSGGGGASDTSVFIVDTTYAPIASVINTDTIRLKSIEVQYNGVPIPPTETDSTLIVNIVPTDTTTVPLMTFSAGAGFVADTSMVTDSSIFGSLFTGQYEYTIKQIQAVIKGDSGDSIVVKIVYNDSFNVDGTKINAAGLSISNRFTGDQFTISTNRTIPVNSWLWVKPESVITGKKPKYVSITLLGYKTYIAP